MRISDWSSDVCSSDLAGAGACVITDAWEGLDLFFAEGAEILVARDGRDVAEMLGSLTPERAREIGASAHAKVLAEPHYARRAGQDRKSVVEGKMVSCRVNLGVRGTIKTKQITR